MQQALTREPRQDEIKLLKTLYEEDLQAYRQSPKAAAEILSVGLNPPPEKIDQAELAAWTSVSRAVLNLHEMITRY